LSFDDVNSSAEPWLLIVGQAYPIHKEKIAAKLLTKGSESFSSFRLRRNPTYNWVLVPTNGSSSLDLEIVWEQDAEIDFAELSHSLDLPFTIYSPQLELAEHSFNGNVTDKLIVIDEDYVELNKDEFIVLTFSAPPIDENLQRTFMFVSRGRYEKEGRTINKQGNLAKTTEELIVPLETKLYENYPNPFNPSTVIKYSLKEEGKVTLKVYNSLGQEVKILTDEVKPAGQYEVVFDASELSSGLYIYKMQTSNYALSRKMMLIK
jgi:hypothetical protein